MPQFIDNIRRLNGNQQLAREGNADVGAEGLPAGLPEAKPKEVVRTVVNPPDYQPLPARIGGK